MADPHHLETGPGTHKEKSIGRPEIFDFLFNKAAKLRTRFARSSVLLVFILMAGVAVCVPLLAATSPNAIRGLALRLRGHRLYAEAPIISVGEVPLGSVVRETALLHNLGPDPVRILGASADCNCLAVDGLPASIGPSRLARFPIRIRGVEPGRRIESRIIFFSDSHRNPRISVVVKGRVGEAPPPHVPSLTTRRSVPHSRGPL